MAQWRGEEPPLTEEAREPPAHAPEIGVDEPLLSTLHDDAHSESVATSDVSLSASAPSASAVDTIRIEPQKLDALMTLAGEMAVTTMRLARSLASVEELVGLWEEWDRDSAALRSLSSVALDTPSKKASENSLNKLARIQEREPERLERMGRLLGQLGRTSNEEITRLGLVADELDEAVRKMRLLPFSSLFNLFPRMVRDLSREQGKEVRLVVNKGDITADKHLLEEMKDPLMHLIRNAIDHGIESPEERLRQGKPRVATLFLNASQTATEVVMEIEDDGRGLDEDAIRRTALQKRLRPASEIAALTPAEVRMLIFAPGFSTSTLITDVSGRGVGLDVVHSNVERLNGTVSVESVPGRGCTFRLRTPITLATTHVLLVQVAQWIYALPAESVLEASLVSTGEIFALGSRPTISRSGQTISVAHLADMLDVPRTNAVTVAGKNNRGQVAPASQACVPIRVDEERCGLFVDALIDEQEVVVKPFGSVLQRVRNVSASTILSTGEICMVLNPRDLIKSALNKDAGLAGIKPSEIAERIKVILLAEDSITTRTQEKRILESAGYEVVTAVDGADAFKKLGTRLFDAVVSDIEMPNMNGLALAARIRQDSTYRELPIILVTSLASDEDRKRGSEVGANAYITKGNFEQQVLLDTLRRLV